MRKSESAGLELIPSDAILNSEKATTYIMYTVQILRHMNLIDPNKIKGDSILLLKKNNQDILKDYHSNTFLNHIIHIITRTFTDRLMPFMKKALENTEFQCSNSNDVHCV